MWTRKLLKENAKIAFQRNYWTCVIVSVLTMLLWGEVGGFTKVEISTDFDSQIAAATNWVSFLTPSFVLFAITQFLIIMALGACFAILISNVITVGNKRYFLENREHKTEAGQILYGFRKHRYGSIVLMMFLQGLYIFLWSLLFVIPGIVKSYSYRMVPYILAENPELNHKRVFQMSRDMMYGHKMEAFVLDLSFIGWHLLGSITLGLVNIFYVGPYQDATNAEFYSAIKTSAMQRSLVQSWELPGVYKRPEQNQEIHQENESENNF